MTEPTKNLRLIDPAFVALGPTGVSIRDRLKGLTPEDAYMLSSVAVDFNITQVVDGVKGVHGMIPKEIFKKK